MSVHDGWLDELSDYHNTQDLSLLEYEIPVTVQATASKRSETTS